MPWNAVDARLSYPKALEKIQRVADCPTFHVLTELANIVRGPSTVQTLKGLVSAGPVKSVRYAAEKVNKWWKGSKSSSSSSPDAGSGSGSKP